MLFVFFLSLDRQVARQVGNASSATLIPVSLEKFLLWEKEGKLRGTSKTLSGQKAEEEDSLPSRKEQDEGISEGSSREDQTSARRRFRVPSLIECLNSGEAPTPTDPPPSLPPIPLRCRLPIGCPVHFFTILPRHQCFHSRGDTRATYTRTCIHVRRALSTCRGTLLVGDSGVCLFHL